MSESATIRKMEDQDIPRVLQIERDSFSFPWSEKSIRDELEKNSLADCVVLELVDKIIGFYIAWHIAGESSLINLAIDPSFQGCGYGKQLMKHFLTESARKKAKDLILEVNVHNERALRLYESYGFRSLFTRKNYYAETGEDAHVMHKKGD